MDKIYIEAKYRVYNHFLQEHMRLNQAPFNYRLCLFRCFKQEELEKHVSSFRRHQLVLQKKNMPDSPDFLVSKSTPYSITDRDFALLSVEESKRHWISISKKTSFLKQCSPTFHNLVPSATFLSPLYCRPFHQLS
ncbi:hypothetical protein DPMN_096464 [Dreissena polymorpha]|uniref:Uncharacterized protein n=1 Tax=Dreissena polymorpha TaxID=45954 RepID=A0A9D4L976_DREPO|nr:hypothetical protein DPMN_096464 [Dreissena polymorpha]